jgi:prephenate dehydrogenase
MTQVAILGTGLIGASIGLALKQNSDVKLDQIIGYDRERRNSRQAKKIGSIDKEEGNLANAVREAGLIILAAPILSNHKLIEEIAPFVAEGAVVTDTGSTKAATLLHAAEHLPQGVHFVGSHPMSGKTEVGPEHADADLFKDQRWVITAPPGASQDSVKVVISLAHGVGALPMIMDAEEHDAYVAAISHMPMVAAHALFQLARRSEAWPELSLLAAGGFKSSTRLAATDPSMAYDIVATNREQTVHWVDRFIEELRRIRDDINNDDREELFTQIAKTELDYSAYLLGIVGRKEEGPGVHTAGLDFSTMLVGQAMKDKIDQMSEGSEERVRERELESRLKRDI